MSKLLRLTLVLLAVLATAFLWSGQAIADPVPPSAEDCASDSTLEGCPQPEDPVVTDGDSAAGESNTGDAGAPTRGPPVPAPAAPRPRRSRQSSPPPWPCRATRCPASGSRRAVRRTATPCPATCCPT